MFVLTNAMDVTDASGWTSTWHPMQNGHITSILTTLDQGTHFINDDSHYLIDHFIPLDIPTLLFIIHKGMDKLSLLTKFSMHCSQN
jgi:hypothetical protein